MPAPDAQWRSPQGPRFQPIPVQPPAVAGQTSYCVSGSSRGRGQARKHACYSAWPTSAPAPTLPGGLPSRSPARAALPYASGAFHSVVDGRCARYSLVGRDVTRCGMGGETPRLLRPPRHNSHNKTQRHRSSLDHHIDYFEYHLNTQIQLPTWVHTIYQSTI